MYERRHDDRIAVRFGALATPAPGEALLVEGDAAVPDGVAVARVVAGAATGHAARCPCCRSQAAVPAALAGLFQARARGSVPWFDRVLAVVADPEGAAAALETDRVGAALFRVVR